MGEKKTSALSGARISVHGASAVHGISAVQGQAFHRGFHLRFTGYRSDTWPVPSLHADPPPAFLSDSVLRAAGWVRGTQAGAPRGPSGPVAWAPRVCPLLLHQPSFSVGFCV